MQFKANTTYYTAAGSKITLEKVTGTWVYFRVGGPAPFGTLTSHRIYTLEDGTEAFMAFKKCVRVQEHIEYAFSKAKAFGVVLAIENPTGPVKYQASKVTLKHTGRSKAAVAAKWYKPNDKLEQINGKDWKERLAKVCKGYCVHVSASYITGADIVDTAYRALSLRWVAPNGRNGRGGTFIGGSNGEFARRMNQMTNGDNFEAFNDGVGMTVNQFVKKFPKGTFSVCNNEHCWTIEDGAIVDWDYSRLRRIQYCIRYTK